MTSRSQPIEEQVTIRVSPAVASQVLADPREHARLAGALPVREITGVPAVPGVTWEVKGGPFRRRVTRFKVEEYADGKLARYRFEGGMSGMMEYRLLDHPEGCQLQLLATFERLPWYFSPSQARTLYRNYLASVGKSLEESVAVIVPPRPDVACLVGQPRVDRVASWLGRRAIHFSARRVVRASVETVYDIAITRIHSAWEWMSDRSDPNLTLDVHGDWPAPGSFYTYRQKCRMALNGWEKGTVTVRESSKPGYALITEHQRPWPFSAELEGRWRFEPEATGTTITVDYTTVPGPWVFNLLCARMVKKDHTLLTKPFVTQLDALARVCETCPSSS